MQAVDALAFYADEGRMLRCEMADQTRCSHYESTVSEWENPSRFIGASLVAFELSLRGTRRTETSKYPEEKIP